MQHDRCQLVFSVSLFRVCELNDVTVLVSSLVDACLVSHVIHSGQLWRCSALEMLCSSVSRGSGSGPARFIVLCS